MEFANNSEIFTVVDGFNTLAANIQVLLHLFSIIVTFPLYIYVHRLNRERDKNVRYSSTSLPDIQIQKSQYTITNHFYMLVCALQFSIYFILIIWLFLHFFLRDAGAIVLLFAFGLITVAAMIMATNVQNVLLFFLALRRFLLFSFPSKRKFLMLEQKTLKQILMILYAFYSCVPIAYTRAKSACHNMVEEYFNETYNSSDVQMKEELDKCVDPKWALFTSIYITGDLLVMSSAVLYTIMLIRVRNWNKLAGDPLNRPEQYIFYQTLFIVVTKLIAVLTAFTMKTVSKDQTFLTFFISDSLTTPFVIQMSYLCCNRTNIDTILAIKLKKLKTWQVLCCAEKPGRQSRKRRNAAVKYARNKVRDLNKGFYPITNHFFYVVCGMQASVYLVILAAAAVMLQSKQSLLLFLMVGFLFISFLAAVVVTSVQNILLFILAFRRFLIFFFPNTKTCLLFNKITFNRILLTLYTFYSSLPVAYTIAKKRCLESVNGTSERTNQNENTFIMSYCEQRVWKLYARIYIAGDVLVMISLIFYTILLIRVRNWSKMIGDVQNRPEQYIFYQTLLIIINKMLGVGIAVVKTTVSDETTFGSFLLTDISTTPFVIQISYLCCNRTNIDTMLSIQLKKLKTWQVLCCAERPERPRRRRRRGRNRVMDQRNQNGRNNGVVN